MNIQQALNQSLLAGATSLYFTGETLEKGKESAIAKYQSAGKERIDAAEQSVIANAIKKDYQKEININDGLTMNEANELARLNTRATKAKARNDVAVENFKRAERNLERWDWNRDEVKGYQAMYDADRMALFFEIDDRSAAARAEAKALRSLHNKTTTATNTHDAVQERINILSGKYKSRMQQRFDMLKAGLNKSMHQPSISKEE